MILNKSEISNIFEKKIKKQVVKIELAKGGHSSLTYKLTDNYNQKFYFKQGNNNYRLQYDLSKILKKMKVFVPEILAFSDSWIIQRGTDGQVLSTNSVVAKKIALKSLGVQLSTIHSIKTIGYGPLKDLGSGIFEKYFDYYKNVIKIIPSKYHSLILNYLNKQHSNCLNHGDVSPYHVYTNSRGKYLSLIDWDDVVSAPAEFDLSELCLNLNNNKLYWDLFLEGYSKKYDVTNYQIENLLIPELLQAYESYNWYIIEKKDELKLLSKIKKSINLVENEINLKNNL